ncbi:hypothetical protein RRG08_048382 [Elysia crispata]|uniref:Uncharacterized protein n=1 Tax=Elysia crispata TaxID=231223 RepID=A0AAE1ECM4_9GAST|nr:hypothetical protein RRG08_048382 [Elysia crispata]
MASSTLCTNTTPYQAALRNHGGLEWNEIKGRIVTARDRFQVFKGKCDKPKKLAQNVQKKENQSSLYAGDICMVSEQTELLQNECMQDV